MQTLRDKITRTREAVRALRTIIDEITNEIAAVEDQVMVAEHRIRWRNVLNELADVAAEADERFRF